MSRGWRVAVPLTMIAIVAALVGPIAVDHFWPGSESQGVRERGPGGPGGGRRRGGGPDAPGGPPVAVMAVEAKLADVPVYLESVGTARPLNTVTVRPQVDGQLVQILFREGQDVRKGDVLARIDPTTYQAQFDQAVAKKAQDQAQLENARRDLERYVRLAETNAVTKQQADTQRATVAQLEAQLKSDQAAIDSAKATLGYTSITSPIDGRTGIRNVDEGNIVKQSDATGLVTISQIQPIATLFSVPQQQLARIIKAHAASPLRVDAMDPEGKGAIDSGTLQVVDNQVDVTTGTVRLKAEFPNKELRLWPGAFVNVRLLVETLKQVVTTPTAAIQRGPKGTFVYVVKSDDTVTVRDVSVGQQDDVETVVASGLQPGERVVTTGFARLAEGARVAVSAPQGQGAAPSEIHQDVRGRVPRGGAGSGEGRRRREGGGPQADGQPGAGGPPAGAAPTGGRRREASGQQQPAP
ncbi:efflux RND transporter periplasmic adaptor subunit [Alsobacter soli]|uniref:Efflux RND transporter periplasmic adaptor subunit n=1 Tax=Alsobacter soli TaxID=2109933 RepID=A0A2T1HRF1_9HYPH|nr:efflux RND transporter periplasmic adaptor subunit [Alsobacter soli]PSC04216.1 efflux RND transporter periplasmic adaptor subunit [Alsobacter soli]